MYSEWLLKYWDESTMQRMANRAIALCAGIILVLAISAIIGFPLLQTQSIPEIEKRLAAENAARQTWIQGIGGLFFVVTAYLSYQTLKANQRNVELAQRNVEATEAKQVAERFSKAVELLANENSMYARLGGIYALEKIAETEDGYYWQIMETLTAYVREKSKAPPDSTDPGDIPPLRTDIQAVMTVLARRKHSYRSPAEPNRLDLRKTDLRGLHLLPEANLAGANLSSSNLQGAILSGVNLQRALLLKTSLEGANLLETNLQESLLSKSNLQSSDFVGAKLQEANLEEANLEMANLTRANLERANLEGANLQDSTLSKAEMEGANLKGSQLQRSWLVNTNLKNAALWGANLYEAKLNGADLSQAKLLASDLRKTKFCGSPDETYSDAVGLTWAQLDQATSYEGAELPNYLLQHPPQNLKT